MDSTDANRCTSSTLWQSEFGEWRLPAADPFDDPTVIRVTVIGEGEVASLLGEVA